MPHMDLSELTFKMPQHWLGMWLSRCPCESDPMNLGLQNAPNLLNCKAFFQCLFDILIPTRLLKSPHPCNMLIDNHSSNYEAIFQDDFTDIDSSSDTEEILNSDSDEENKLLYLMKMGYSEAEASIVMERYQITQRTLPEDAIESPYFYYKKVALAPVGVWTEMSRNKVDPLEPDEVEILIGFPKNHTRGGGSARDMFPGGINVLSIFSKISDTEVAFYCLGIPLKVDI
ncbi:hypothetical protein F3Y22_tig00002982pilonHSYRG00062 [Hibiscus syriacus]|uniref:DNA (Cytosine-5)-methyltransferase DRM1/2 n=1 Tax=Hibiscus syriacus TaxID=106335 RepID=A0A6A3CNL6_HIBSY|nr:hypothetical protein F3Y22_tig00002982pilonHSYRG00062 [Hibiscus syriacus]